MECLRYWEVGWDKVVVVGQDVGVGYLVFLVLDSGCLRCILV